MKAIDLLLMLMTFNVVWAILSGTGCFTNSSSVSFDFMTVEIATFITILSACLAAYGLVGRFLNPIGSAFFLAFTGLWSFNVTTLDAFVQFSSSLGWLPVLLTLIVGPIIGILGALEIQTGVRL